MSSPTLFPPSVEPLFWSPVDVLPKKLAFSRPAGEASVTDFFRSHEGTAEPLPARRRERLRLRIRDIAFECRVRFGMGLRRARRASKQARRRVLIVGVEVPSRAADIHDTIGRLTRGSRHDITVSVAPMENRGKFANVEAAIAAAAKPLADFDWLVITDDDISFKKHFLDDLIDIASFADLALSQPCHSLQSFATYEITKRRYGVLARRTHFVEIGPLTLVRADLFESLIPFPPSRWCYGIDLIWSVDTRRAGCRMGIVDGTAVRHLRPVANSYDIDAAREEGESLLVERGVVESRAQFFGVDDVVAGA